MISFSTLLKARLADYHLSKRRLFAWQLEYYFEKKNTGDLLHY